MHEHRRSDMNGIIKRLAVLGVSAVFSASLAACTEEDIPQLSISKNITLDFDDSFDFGADACKGLKLCSLIPGKCIITSADIDEPEISFDFSFNGLSRAELEEQRDNIDVSYSIAEDTEVLSVSVMDKSTNSIAGQKSADFSNTTAVALITLPEYFDFFDITADECDIGAENLSGDICLNTHKSITGESLTFSDSQDNLLTAGGDAVIGASFNALSRSNAEISSGGALTYICPAPEQMSSREKPDTIRLNAEKKLTVDLNGNTYSDEGFYDKDNNDAFYQYLIGDAVALAPEYGNVEGNFYITNGDYIYGEKSSPTNISKTTVRTSSSVKTKTTAAKTTAVKTSAAETTFDDFSDNTYVEYKFRTKKQLEQHFSKHGDEFKDDFNYKSAKDYEKGASDVINNKSALHKTEKEDGDGVYYIEETNEFVILSTDGYIRTYFRPSSGKKYYDKQ